MSVRGYDTYRTEPNKYMMFSVCVMVNPWFGLDVTKYAALPGPGYFATVY